MKSNFKLANKFRRGQILLIVIMLLATTLTVVLSLSFRSVTETKLTKLEEENQRAIAAAESAIEQALKTSDLSGEVSFSTLGLSFEGINNDSSNVVLDPTTYNYFVTPLLLKDDQYVYYLDDYSPTTNQFLAAPFTGNLDFYIQSTEGSGHEMAVELTFLSDSVSDPKILRYLLDPNSIVDVGTGGKARTTMTVGTYNLGNTVFNYKTQASVPTPSGAKILIVRVLNYQTRVGIQGSSNLKPQGRTIVANTKATAGGIKKIRFFQSYPQIPAEFFVSNF